MRPFYPIHSFEMGSEKAMSSLLFSLVEQEAIFFRNHGPERVWIAQAMRSVLIYTFQLVGKRFGLFGYRYSKEPFVCYLVHRPAIPTRTAYDTDRFTVR